MPARRRPLLTPAQWLVLARLAAGEDNAAIGAALGIGHSTVGSHIKAIYQRLPAVSQGSKRVAAVTWYLTVGRALRERGEQQAQVGQASGRHTTPE